MNIIDKDYVLHVLTQLYEDVQSMRESGETDLRTVLHYIDNAEAKIKIKD